MTQSSEVNLEGKSQKDTMLSLLRNLSKICRKQLLMSFIKVELENIPSFASSWKICYNYRFAHLLVQDFIPSKSHISGCMIPHYLLYSLIKCYLQTLLSTSPYKLYLCKYFKAGSLTLTAVTLHYWLLAWILSIYDYLTFPTHIAKFVFKHANFPFIPWLGWQLTEANRYDLGLYIIFYPVKWIFWKRMYNPIFLVKIHIASPRFKMYLFHF